MPVEPRTSQPMHSSMESYPQTIDVFDLADDDAIHHNGGGGATQQQTIEGGVNAGLFSPQHSALEVCGCNMRLRAQ